MGHWPSIAAMPDGGINQDIEGTVIKVYMSRPIEQSTDEVFVCMKVVGRE